MENANSEAEREGPKIPIGFRFRPTDEELVVHYLRRKVHSLPFPATVIPEFDVFQSNPWDLPGELKEKRYFFSKCKRNMMNKCSSISFNSGCGYWKVTGKDKQIVAPGTNIVIGIRKSFVFYKGKSKTQWVMREFSVVGSISTPYVAQKLMIQVGDWVVCRLHQRKKKPKINCITSQLTKSKKSGRAFPGVVIKPPPIECENLGKELLLPSSCSSGITEISSSDLDQEANSRM